MRMRNTLTTPHAWLQVDKAVQFLTAHLEWRDSYKLEDVVLEDFQDLKRHEELYWAGRDLDGTMTLTYGCPKTTTPNNLKPET